MKRAGSMESLTEPIFSRGQVDLAGTTTNGFRSVVGTISRAVKSVGLSFVRDFQKSKRASSRGDSYLWKYSMSKKFGEHDEARDDSRNA